MANAKTAVLSGLLVSKKATDVPRPEHPGLEAAQTPVSSLRAESEHHSSTESLTSAQSAYYKALTLKVDKDRFMKLKSLGVQKDLRSQALMTEALDLLFAKHHL